MASGGTPCEAQRTTSGRRTEEQLVYYPSVVNPGERRCFMYKPIRMLRKLCEASSGVCRIQVKGDSDNDKKEPYSRFGTCFLGEFEARRYSEKVRGLFTASHVLGEADIHNCAEVTIINQEGSRGLHSRVLKIQDSPFYFTCPLFDVTFIEFDKALQDKLTQQGFNFLHVYTQWQGDVGRVELHLLHYPGARDNHDQYFSTGHLEKYNGLHVFHSASTEDGSSGAPVVVESCDVVAIHTARSEDAKGNYNVALAVKSFFEVMIEARSSNVPQAHILRHHPTKDELMKLQVQLQSLGLEMQRARDKENQSGPPRIPFYFTHPKLQVSDVKDPVEVHFVLTSHGWYWSELAPDNGAEEPSWVPATTNRFGRGSNYMGKTVEDDPNGFSFAKLQSIAIGIDNLTSKFNQLFVSNKEKEYSS